MLVAEVDTRPWCAGVWLVWSRGGYRCRPHREVCVAQVFSAVCRVGVEIAYRFRGEEVWRVRSNRREPLRLSRMAAGRVSLWPGEKVQVACPFCGRWRLLERSMLRPHRADDGRRRCPGSGQRVLVDESPAEWMVRFDLAQRRTLRDRR